jgi:hypothetical protein
MKLKGSRWEIVPASMWDGEKFIPPWKPEVG